MAVAEHAGGAAERRRPPLRPRLASTMSAVAWSVSDAMVSRMPLPRVALLGVPLAITASIVGGEWWMIAPLAWCAWWALGENTGWSWLTAVLRGLIGAAWASAGVSALVAFPRATIGVGVLWAGSAGLLAIFSREPRR
jgi:hypothetical protein